MPLPDTSVFRDEYTYAALNGETPTVYIKFTRPGTSDTIAFEIHPTHFEYVSSVTSATMVQFTVPDEGYDFIDNHVLQEDLKTQCSVKFGYVDSQEMSDLLGPFVFFRQKPSFPQGGHVETTITAYDKSILLALPTVPRLIHRGDQGFSVKEMVELIVDEARALLNMKLDVTFVLDPNGNNTDAWEGRHWRFAKPVGSPLEFLYYMRSIAEGKNRTAAPIEIFVKGDMLYFRPVDRGKQPTKYYYYRDVAPGARLLSFEPEVNVHAQRHAAVGAHPVLDQAAASVVGPETKTGTAEMTGESATVESVKGAMTHKAVTGAKGDPKKEVLVDGTTLNTHAVTASEHTLFDVVRRYPGVKVEDILARNPSLGTTDTSVVLKVGQQLLIPVPVKITAEEAKQSVESRVKAAVSYLMEHYEAVKAKCTVIGDPTLEAGEVVAIYNVGEKWSGAWYIDEVRHVYNSSGYLCDLTLTRDGFPIGTGMDSKANANVEEHFEDTDKKKPETSTSDSTADSAGGDVKRGVTPPQSSSSKPDTVTRGAARVKGGKTP